ncbi:MAG: Rpn family recombination-promoting nuclease/putative transposase [Proteobacteria bacterium]|uniref:Rpn family recombination-promoting nuclease/putative transposase n=1 Tax=Candidatus Avisuccinivibrio stercorigallinarum TaxID=2840704 RepID=A0A9D9GTK4_9GAMM|nr:Rpn family recombination-promoting nuclease/putative transposase [Candidatus Avisuccinivibrio stercorigallinarum]
METLKQGTPDAAPDQVSAQTQNQTPVQNGVNNAADAPENNTNKSKGEMGDDNFYKILYADPQVFIDLLPKVLPERILAALDLSPDRVEPFPETSHEVHGSERRNDIIYKVRLKKSRKSVIILLEFQTKVSFNFSWWMVNYTHTVYQRLSSLMPYKGSNKKVNHPRLKPEA